MAPQSVREPGSLRDATIKTTATARVIAIRWVGADKRTSGDDESRNGSPAPRPASPLTLSEWPSADRAREAAARRRLAVATRLAERTRQARRQARLAAWLAAEAAD